MYKKYITKRGKKIGPYYYESVRLPNGRICAVYLGRKQPTSGQRQAALRSFLEKKQVPSTVVQTPPPHHPFNFHPSLFYAFFALFLLVGFFASSPDFLPFIAESTSGFFHSFIEGSPLTGYAISSLGSSTEQHNLSIHRTFNSSTSLTLRVSGVSGLKSVKLSGAFSGNTSNKTFLVLFKRVNDSESLVVYSSRMTDRVVGAAQELLPLVSAAPLPPDVVDTGGALYTSVPQQDGNTLSLSLPERGVHFVLTDYTDGSPIRYTEDVPGIVAPSKAVFVNTYAVDASRLTYVSLALHRAAQGTSLYTCRNWDASLNICLGSWEFVRSLAGDYEVSLDQPVVAFAEAVSPSEAQRQMGEQNAISGESVLDPLLRLIQPPAQNQTNFTSVCVDTCRLRGYGDGDYTISLVLDNGTSLTLDQLEIEYTPSGTPEFVLDGLVLTSSADVDEAIFPRPKEEIPEYIAIAGQPVRWQKEYVVDSLLKSRGIPLPLEATDVSVQESGTSLLPLQENVPFELTSSEYEQRLHLLTDVTRVRVHYLTPAPVLDESNASHGKTIVLTSPMTYHNVLVRTPVDASYGLTSDSCLTVYWEENETSLPYRTLDTDNDRIIDIVEWTAPTTSTESETFDLILVTKAYHLDENRQCISNVYLDVRAYDDRWTEPIYQREYLRVTFEQELASENDITVYVRNNLSAPLTLDVYYFNSTERIAEFSPIEDEGFYQIFLTEMNGTHDTFDLQVTSLLNGKVNNTDLNTEVPFLEFDYVVDPALNTGTSHDVDIAILNGSATTSFNAAGNIQTDVGMFVIAWCDASDNSARYQVWYTNGTAYNTTSNTFDAGAGASCRISVDALNATTFVIGYLDWSSTATAWNVLGRDIDNRVIFGPITIDADMNANTDICVTAFNSSTYFTAVIDDLDDDATYAIYNLGTAGIGPTDVDLAVAPDVVDSDLIDCAAMNSSQVFLAYYDDAPDNIVGMILDYQGNLRINGTIVNSATDAGVAVAGLQNGGGVVAFCQGSQDDLRFVTIDAAGASVSGAITVDANVGTCGTDSGTHLEVAALNSTDSRFMYIFSTSVGRNNSIAVYNYTGSEILAPTFIANLSNGAINKAVAVGSYDPVSRERACGLTINPQNALLSFNNLSSSTTLAFWEPYNETGAKWNGVCDVFIPTLPYIVLDYPANDTTFTSLGGITLNGTVFDKDPSDLLNVTIYGQRGTPILTAEHILFYNVSYGNATRFSYNWTAPPINGTFFNDPLKNITLLLHLDTNDAYGENTTFFVDFSGNLNATSNVKMNMTRTGGILGGGVGRTQNPIDPSINLNNTGITASYIGVNISYSVWILTNHPNLQKLLLPIMDKWSLNLLQGFRIYRNETNLSYQSDNNVPVTFPNFFTNGVWTHLVVVVEDDPVADNNPVRIYKDGALYNGTTTMSTPTAPPAVVRIAGEDDIFDTGGFHGVIDEFVIVNGTLNASDVTALYQLSAGTYYWNVNLTDSYSLKNESETRQFTIQAANSAPTVTEASLLPSSSNTTDQLYCQFTPSDDQTTSLQCTTTFYVDNVTSATVTGGFTSGQQSTQNHPSVGVQNKKEAWTCGVNCSDGSLGGAQVNSSSTIIVNTPPLVPRLHDPVHGNRTTNTTLTFYWNASADADNDALNYTINITVLSGVAVFDGGDHRQVLVVDNVTNYSITDDLDFFFDDGYTYNWTVRATDGDNTSAFAVPSNVSFDVLLSLNLTQSLVDFGGVTPGQAKNTPTNAPDLLLQNLGNALMNVNHTSNTFLFDRLSAASSGYQLNVSNGTISGGGIPYNAALSATNLTNITTSQLKILVNFTENAFANISYFITVPSDELSGVKNATVTFTGYYLTGAA